MLCVIFYEKHQSAFLTYCCAVNFDGANNFLLVMMFNLIGLNDFCSFLWVQEFWN